MVVSREELYRLVWAIPMTHVAKQFDVSSSYMARVCALLNIPRPDRGYWAKLEVGRAPPAEPLSEARPGDQLHWSRDGQHLPPPKPRPPQRRPDVPVRILKNRTHGLILGAREHFENSRPGDDDAYLRPYKKLLVDVTSSKACLGKALDFANDLFNAFESVGHRVVIAPPHEQLRCTSIDERENRTKQRPYSYYNSRWSPRRPTVVYVGGVAIGLAVTEMSEEVLLRYINGKYIREAEDVAAKPARYHVDHSWTTTREIPSGRLRLVAYSPYWRVDWSADWQETKKKSLCSAIKSIVTFVENATVDLVAKIEEADWRAEVARQEQLIAEEKRRREEDRRCTEQSRLESREELAKIIQRWADAMSVERFLAGVEQRVGILPENEQAPVQERLKLAREFLGTQDPLDFFLSWKIPKEHYLPVYS
jgi:hypothetical protein